MMRVQHFRSRKTVKALRWEGPTGIMVVLEERRAAERSTPVNVNPGDWLIFGTYDEREGVVAVKDDENFRREYEALPCVMGD